MVPAPPTEEGAELADVTTEGILHEFGRTKQAMVDALGDWQCRTGWRQ